MTIAFGITLTLVTYLHDLRRDGSSQCRRDPAARGVALWIVPTLVTFSKIFAPVVAPLNNLSNKCWRS